MDDDFQGLQVQVPHENFTIDVVHKGCYGSYDPIACTRSCLLSLTMAVTALLCVVRVFQLHHEKHPQLHHYFIFYSATVECIISAVYWSCGKQYPRIDFIQSYLKLTQFVVICHFYWFLAMRIIHRETLVNRSCHCLIQLTYFSVVIPILVVYGGYFTTVAALGMIDVKSTWIECLEPEWLFLSAVEFMAVQLFAIAGVYITKKLNQISSDETFKSGQKRDLWSVILVYETSALLSLSYDSVMKFLGDEKIGCSGVFGHDQMLYSLIFAFFMIVKFVLPLWVTLCVFHPSPLQTIDHESIFGWSFDGSASTSVFRPHNILSNQNPHCSQFHFSADNYVNQAIIDGLPFDKVGNRVAVEYNQGYTSGYINRLQSSLTPITEEDGVSESIGSQRSTTIFDVVLVTDNRPLLTCMNTSKDC